MKLHSPLKMGRQLITGRGRNIFSPVMQSKVAVLVRYNCNMIQARIALDESHNEGLYRSGWPSDLQGIALIFFHHMGILRLESGQHHSLVFRP